jgi:hypothetical protein
MLSHLEIEIGLLESRASHGGRPGPLTPRPDFCAVGRLLQASLGVLGKTQAILFALRLLRRFPFDIDGVFIDGVFIA